MFTLIYSRRKASVQVDNQLTNFTDCVILGEADTYVVKQLYTEEVLAIFPKQLTAIIYVQ